MLEKPIDISRNHTNSWLLAAGACLLLLLCLGGAFAGVFLLGGLGAFLALGSLPPSFTTAETLAYDVVYETAGADAGTIQTIQSQAAGALHAVLVRYETDGQPQVRLVLARDTGREFLVANGTAGPNAANAALDAAVFLHPNSLDSEVAVYGRLLDPAIQRV
ncbi:MAG: hypothetical protein L0332_29985, partial [Chloroflexi bacterium]|nr:hypothetical protein [Chloroflexota bacterium]MCI0730932.1 hypothetical protein [Chloroflexota bacterium]